MFNSYQQAEQFIDSRKKYGIKPGLDRINQLLALAGNPQNKLKAVHVAGTNGKGSTINFIKSALVFNEYKVGTFCSPSMGGLTGHIFLDDKTITEAAFIEILNEIYPAIQVLDRSENYPTEFEIITVIAFCYFAKHADVALIETGMGGLEDTTNCFIPILSIITNVEKDHIDFLGDSITKIAYHKAGIIKENRPVIIGNLNLEALAVVNHVAVSKHAKVYQLSKDFHYKFVGQASKLQKFNWYIEEENPKTCAIEMNGEHQINNATLAIMCIVKLEELGFPVDWEKALLGIQLTQVPGRFEVVHEYPTVILDGAHNVAGIKTFIQTVLQNFPTEERHVIFAGFKDKDLSTMLSLLQKHFTSITVTTFEHKRAAKTEELDAMLKLGHEHVVENWQAAIDSIIKLKSEEKVYFVTGSLNFIANVRQYFVNN